MNSDSWLRSRSEILGRNGVESPRLDCVLMLERVLHIDRAQLYAHLDENLSSLQLAALEVLFARRYKHEPMAYILGSVEFYGRRFSVNEHVLVPRPESEDIITLVKDQSPIDTLLDIGTGSGALAITAALETRTSHVYGIDIDPACITVAQNNGATYNTPVTFVVSDLLSDWQSEHVAEHIGIMANLPYVPDDYPINSAARHEPALALFSGPDGLNHYRKLFAQLPTATAWIVCESLEQQHEPLAELASEHGLVLSDTRGLAQLFRPHSE